MKQNNHGRPQRRFNNNRSGSRPVTIYRNTCLDSTGPAGKLRGTPLQLMEKYTACAKDAATQNDMILAEQYRQYADHYMRLQNLAIENENALRAAKEAQQTPVQDVSGSGESTDVETITESQVNTEADTETQDLSVPVAQMNESSEENSQ